MAAFLAEELLHPRLVPFRRFAYRALQREVARTCRPHMVALVAVMLPGIQGVEYTSPAFRTGFVLRVHNPFGTAELAGVVLLDAHVVPSGTAAGTDLGFLIGAYHPEMAASVTERLLPIPELTAHERCLSAGICILDITTIVFYR